MTGPHDVRDAPNDQADGCPYAFGDDDGYEDWRDDEADRRRDDRLAEDEYYDHVMRDNYRHPRIKETRR